MIQNLLRNLASVRVARQHSSLPLNSVRIAWSAETARRRFQQDKQLLRNIQNVSEIPTAIDPQGNAITKIADELAHGGGSGVVLAGIFSGLFYPALKLLNQATDSCLIMQTAADSAESRRWLQDFSAKIGVTLERKPISRESSVAFVRKLKRNGVVLAMADVAPPEADAFDVDFFGHPARTASGLYRLCHLTGTPIVPVLFERTGAGITVHSGDVCKPTTNAHALAVTVHAQLEQLIASHPDQWWMWSHLLDRWGGSATLHGVSREPAQAVAAD